MSLRQQIFRGFVALEREVEFCHLLYHTRLDSQHKYKMNIWADEVSTS